MASSDFDISARISHITPGAIVEARNAIVDRLWDWVLNRYPKINLETLERNLPQLEEIKKYDDKCPSCMSVQMCPSLDGNRMQGRLDADGVMTIWMQGCPQGYKLPKNSSGETKTERKWAKK